MKRWIGLWTFAFSLVAAVALAQPTHPDGALGFHDADAPLGVRWWLSGQKLAFDVGLGFGSDKVGGISLSHFALDAGLPIALKSWDRVHFLVRPGILYRSQEEVTDPGPPVVTDNTTHLVIQGELEAEVFVVDNVSVSAAQGFAIDNINFAGGGSATNFGTTGSNFTTVGFHVYLFGSGGGGEHARMR